ncbi:MAG TPA: OB-fold domain-containing protein [Phycisphaerae bacterium]|nr:OB-fold domain-containing protein [Phycisphaerae bacterium]HOJ75970.1 OB-fold domain-containing protein [Phycisphaerae bacterium]HOM53354.1 OB-fold domain-containing protein [Phycisphaerae bacterium]HON66670.1 OB-fold domain-containing protein [Phycisphaerae bacterium]HOQ84441.1 OB-fold domain-containing protein [Phycisphaerae bacterium]
MIARLTGILAEVCETHVILEREGIGYEVLICGYALGELTARRGQEVTFHTLQYLEGSSAGGNMIPRLVGFLHPEDRAFFERFITVKGIGVRKALKALTISTAKMASAIEAGDAKSLSRLPGIGARAADQIVAELKGKVANFAFGSDGDVLPEAAVTWSEAQKDAIEVMVALGERRVDAERWLQRAIQLAPETETADEWVRLAYRVRTGA